MGSAACADLLRSRCAHNLGGDQEVATDDKDIVSAVRRALADRVGLERFDLWFNTAARLSVRDGALWVEADTAFAQEFLRANFAGELRDVCRAVTGRAMPVQFRVDPAPRAAVPPTAPSAPVSSPPRDDRRDAATPPPDGDAQSAQPGGAGSRPAAQRFRKFDDYVVGATNQLAVTSARMIVQQTGAFNSLLVHGPPGVGKTHLLEAVWCAARQANDGTRAVFLSAEQFTSLFVEAVRGSGLPSFRSKYRNVGLLIVDDVQFFANKRATLIELLHTIDTLLRHGRRVVLAADRGPADLAALGPELCTRIGGGMTARIDLPDLRMRREIVGQLAARMRAAMPANVLALVAARLSHASARELGGALNRLHAVSLAAEQPVTPELAGQVLDEICRESAPTIRLADIERAVCDTFGLEPNALRTARKSKSVSHPRMLAMWLARKHTRAALSEIGRYFGGRSHTTVISARKKIDGWMQSTRTLELADRDWTAEQAIRRVEESLRVG